MAVGRATLGRQYRLGSSSLAGRQEASYILVVHTTLLLERGDLIFLGIQIAGELSSSSLLPMPPGDDDAVVVEFNVLLPSLKGRGRCQ